MSTRKNLFEPLTPLERVLVGMILVIALLNMLSVASVLPTMPALANSELVQPNAALNAAFTTSRHIGIHTIDQLLFALVVLVFLLLVTSLAYKVFIIPMRKPALL